MRIFKKIGKFIKIWWLFSLNSFRVMLGDRIGVFCFLVGKILRFLLFMVFIIFLTKKTNSIAGYGPREALFVFLTFNIVDVVSQFLFREVYRFGAKVSSGEFDFILLKPISPLFRSLMGGADVLDLITVFPLLGLVIFVGKDFSPDFLRVFLFIILIVNSILISASFHIFVLALSLVFWNLDYLLQIYRDLMGLGRFPIEIYREPVRTFLNFFIPVGIMIMVPARTLIGMINIKWILLSFLISFVFVCLSLLSWKYALRKYTSYSS